MIAPLAKRSLEMAPQSSRLCRVMRIGRNEPCPCGSGKKFKVCCEGKQSTRKASLGLIVLVCTILAIAAAGVIASIRDAKEAPVAAGSGGQVNIPRPQPPGPVPPGKVWSPEHGHWHDAAPAPAPSPVTIPAQQPATPQPQPPGPAPEGKVWSPEHGHWHEAPKK